MTSPFSLFSPTSHNYQHNLEFQGFEIIAGQYTPLQPTAQGWLLSQQLELYLGIHDEKLRFFTLEGNLVPTSQERAEQLEERVRLLEGRLSSASLSINPDE